MNIITEKKFHYLFRLGKRTVPIFKKKNRFKEYYSYSFKRRKKINQLITSKIIDGSPFMLARYGSFEASTIVNYYLRKKVKNDFEGILYFLKGEINEYWKYSPKKMKKLCNNAGFFPEDESLIEKFVEIMIDSSLELDVLPICNYHEEYLPNIPEDTTPCHLRDIEPWFHEDPWSYHLKGKKVLIVHPFEESIKKQYAIREKIFSNPKILPEFDLITLKAVQSAAGGEDKNRFKDWFQALNYMKNQIDAIDFDVAIIGCGAYGFPLAAHVKKIGKQAVHLGGVTQLLFGIKGKRWERWEEYRALQNENWITASERPKDYKNIEDGCYW